MKFLLLCGAFVAIAVNAPAPDEEAGAVGQWLQQRVMQAAAQASTSPAGSYRVVRLADLDAPEEVKQQLRADIERSNGVVQAAAGNIPSQAEMLAAVPRTQRSASEPRQRLPQPPSSQEASVLGPAELIGMEPSGALEGGRSSGLSRFFQLEGVGVVEFSENNFVAAGTHIEVIAEAQNTTVKGAPAHVKKSADSAGRTRVELAWTGDSKTYSLIATGERGSDVERNARVLHDIAADIVD